MKKTIFALSLMTAAVIGCAPANAGFSTPHKRCTVISNFAETIMDARQKGVPIKDLMEKSGDNQITAGIIRQAYDAPLWGSSEFKKQAVTEFSNDWYKSCMQVEDERAR